MDLATILQESKWGNLSNIPTDLSTEDYKQLGVQAYNNSLGELTGFDCELCKNKGNVMIWHDGTEWVRDCRCMKARREYWHLEDSGLRKLVENNSFDNFEAQELWQARIKKKAKEFCQSGFMFFIGGQSGCGKSHVCCAIVSDLLQKLQQVKFMRWREDSVKLKSLVNTDQYEANIQPLKTAEVLYIDDFWKSKEVTAGDINLAFELLNYRYNEGLKTIISTELHTADILKIDEAIGGRIMEMAKGFCLNIERQAERNYRLKGVETI